MPYVPLAYGYPQRPSSYWRTTETRPLFKQGLADKCNIPQGLNGSPEKLFEAAESVPEHSVSCLLRRSRESVFMERENATLNLGKQGTRIAMGCQAKFPEPTPSSEVASAYTRRMDASYSHVVRNCISTKGQHRRSRTWNEPWHYSSW